MGGVILYSDQHFFNHVAYARELQNNEFPGTNSRFVEIARTFQRCVDYAISVDAEAILLCGDLFHSRQNIHIPTYNAVYSLFKEASKQINLIAIYGNHDVADVRAMYAHSGLHSLLAFENNVTIFDKPGKLELDEFSIGLIPFCVDKNEVISASNTLLKKSSKLNVLLLHHSFNGALTGPQEWVMGHSLNPEEIASWDKIFSGHYHMCQKIGQVQYIGAPLQHNFGERTYTPGFIHLNSDGTWKQIENTVSPRFQLVTDENASSVRPQDYVKMQFKGLFSEGEQLRKDNPDWVVEIQPESVRTVARTTISTSDSAEDMMKKYMKNKLGNIDKTLLQVGTEIYQDK